MSNKGVRSREEETWERHLIQLDQIKINDKS